MKSTQAPNKLAALIVVPAMMLMAHVDALSASLYLNTDLSVIGPSNGADPDRTVVASGSEATQPVEITSQDSKSDGSAVWAAGAGSRAQAGSVGVYSYAQVNGLTTGNTGLTTSTATARYTDSVSFSSAGSSTIGVRLDAEALFDFIVFRNATDPEMGGSGSAYGDGWFLGYVEWNFFGAGGNYLRTDKWQVCSGWFYPCYSSSVPEGLYSYNYETTVQSGGRIDITTYMFAYSAVGLYNNVTGVQNGGEARWDTSAYNSMRNGVTILTDGATLVAESGHDYRFVPHQTSVPEPGTLALVGLGLAGFAFSRRRKAN